MVDSKKELLKQNNELLKSIERRVTHYINYILLRRETDIEPFEKPNFRKEGGSYSPELAELKAISPELYTYIVNIIKLILKGGDTR